MIKTLGLVLNRQNIGETDRLITIFSPDLGKKRVLAKAVRRPLSKLAGHLDTFMVTQLMLTEGDLPKVTSAVLAEPFEEIRASLDLTNKAFAISRIVERVILEDMPSRAVFRTTLDAIARLNDGRSWTAVWLYFLTELAQELGVGISDFHCQRCRTRLVEDAYWSYDERRFSCQRCQGSSGALELVGANTIKLMQLLKQKPFLTVERIKIPPQTAEQTEELILREITQWLNKPWSSYAQLNK